MKSMMFASFALAAALVWGQGRNQAPPAPTGPWMNKSLSPDQRADLLIQQMTLDEKLQLVHAWADSALGRPAAAAAPATPPTVETAHRALEGEPLEWWSGLYPGRPAIGDPGLADG